MMAPVRAILPAMLAIVAACQSDEVRRERPPLAFGGYDQTIQVGSEVALDASLSQDPDGDPLRYSWAFLARPPGSNALLEPAGQRLSHFVADRAGHYLVSLTVDDGSALDRDLIGLTAVEGSTVTPALAVPPLCAAQFGALFSAPCGLSDRRVDVTPQLLSLPPGQAGSIAWSFLRLPPGVAESELMAETPSGPTGELSFLVPRPGEYWVGARLISGIQSSPLVVASIAVFDDGTPLRLRPVPVLVAERSARVGARVLFDGRASLVPTASVAANVERRFSIVGAPTPEAELVDVATGCPPSQCRLLFPTTVGTYLIGLQLQADDLASGTVIHALEVW